MGVVVGGSSGEAEDDAGAFISVRNYLQTCSQFFRLKNHVPQSEPGFAHLCRVKADPVIADFKYDRLAGFRETNHCGACVGVTQAIAECFTGDLEEMSALV